MDFCFVLKPEEQSCSETETFTKLISMYCTVNQGHGVTAVNPEVSFKAGGQRVSCHILPFFLFRLFFSLFLWQILIGQNFTSFSSKNCHKKSLTYVWDLKWRLQKVPKKHGLHMFNKYKNLEGVVM